MNYLAHLYLADDSPESLIGNLLGDFLKGIGPQRYSYAIRQGIRGHQRIDRYTDAHPVFVASKNRLRPPYRRYGGVLVDVFYDHFLAKNWRLYSPSEELEAFSERAYGTLRAHESILPPRLRRMLPHMIREDWLTSYRTVEGIHRTLNGLARRARRVNPLATASAQLLRHYGDLEADFARFFPELIQFVDRSRLDERNGSPQHQPAPVA